MMHGHDFTKIADITLAQQRALDGIIRGAEAQGGTLKLSPRAAQRLARRLGDGSHLDDINQRELRNALQRGELTADKARRIKQLMANKKGVSAAPDLQISSSPPAATGRKGAASRGRGGFSADEVTAYDREIRRQRATSGRMQRQRNAVVRREVREERKAREAAEAQAAARRRRQATSRRAARRSAAGYRATTSAPHVPTSAPHVPTSAPHVPTSAPHVPTSVRKAVSGGGGGGGGGKLKYLLGAGMLGTAALGAALARRQHTKEASVSGIPKHAVSELLKTASAKIMQQEEELNELRAWYNNAQTLTKAASVADRMVASGQIDMSDRDAKAYELANAPERLPIVEEAINMIQNPSAFSVASISDEYGSTGASSRSQFESFLLGN
jgi:hypothetical protein